MLFLTVPVNHERAPHCALVAYSVHALTEHEPDARQFTEAVFPYIAPPRGSYIRHNGRIALRRGPISIEIVDIGSDQQIDLPQVADGTCGQGDGACFAQSWQQHGRQYPDNRNDDEQLDERESVSFHFCCSECDWLPFPIRRKAKLELSRLVLHGRKNLIRVL